MPTVIDGDFEWDAEKAIRNLAKHQVSFTEAASAFEDPHGVDAPDMFDPERSALIARSQADRVLFVVYCERGARVRMISARLASPAQRRIHEEGA